MLVSSNLWVLKSYVGNQFFEVFKCVGLKIVRVLMVVLKYLWVSK